MSNIHFSSVTDEWATPCALFDALNAEFAFSLDAASTHENCKCEKHYTQEDDSLKQDWTTETAIFCNPPYSRILCPKFIAKAAKTASESQTTVVMLIPNRPNAAWFKHIYQQTDPANPVSPVTLRAGVELRPLPQRIKFGNATTGAPFPSIVVIFRPTN